MKMLSRLFLICFITTITFAKDNDLINLLIISKTTGMCGTLKQLAYFQSTTKMSGGDEFIERFIKTESARLGKSTEQLLKECENAVGIYTSYMNVLENSK